MSLITSIELENFMSIEHGKVEFDDSNIICLCGYNDSGKSAFTEAIEIIFYDSYSRDQVNFIQDNKEYFKVTISFDDGVDIVKTKLRNGNGIWELKQAGTVLYTNQLNSAIASVDKVPEAIEKYLGVIMDEYTQSLLNVRRNRDKLLLVGTSGGDNYKIFNSILKSDLLAETSKRLNTDKNKLNTECNNKSNSLQTIANEIDCMNCAEEDSLNELSSDIANVTKGYEIVATLENIVKLRECTESFVDWGEIKGISVEQYSELEKIKQLMDIIQQPIHEECATIDTTRVDMLNSIAVMRKQIEGIEILPEVTAEIDVNMQNRIKELEAVLAYNKELSAAIEAANTVEKEYNGVLIALQEYSKQFNFKICPNCGTVVID